MRDSFILYTEYVDAFDALTIEQRGILITAILHYEADMEIPAMDPLTSMAFQFIKNNLNRSDSAYEKKSSQASAAGKASGEARRKKREQKSNDVEQTTNDRSTTVQHNVNEDVNEDLNEDVNENDNVLDNENENVNPFWEPKGSCSERCSEPLADVDAIILNDGSEWRPTQEDFDDYVRLYPAVDVYQQFAIMRRWCKDNPGKRKTSNGVKGFVTRWLKKEQDSGRGRAAPTDRYAGIREWAATGG